MVAVIPHQIHIDGTIPHPKQIMSPTVRAVVTLGTATVVNMLIMGLFF